MALPTAPPARHLGIDAARYLLCFPIILIDIIGWPTSRWQQLLLTACGAAVPAFFIIGGYFQHRRRDQGFKALLIAPAMLIMIHLVWLLIYYGAIALASPAPIRFELRDLATGGLAYHLWFFPALAGGLIIAAVAVSLGGMMAGAALALLLAGASYAFPELPGTRVLEAPLFVMIGWLWAERGWRPRVSISVIAAIALWLLPFVIGGPIVRLAGPAVATFASALIYYAFGTAAFAIALSLPALSLLKFPAALGSLSLGIYALHLALLPLIMPNIALWSKLAVAEKGMAVLLIATILSFGGALIPYLWRLFTTRRIDVADFVATIRAG